MIVELIMVRITITASTDDTNIKSGIIDSDSRVNNGEDNDNSEDTENDGNDSFKESNNNNTSNNNTTATTTHPDADPDAHPVPPVHCGFARTAEQLDAISDHIAGMAWK